MLRNVNELDTGVYMWLNTVNGKVYIGSTARSLTGRKKGHIGALRKGLHCNRYFQYAWDKYGEEAFEFSVVEKCWPEMVIAKEQHWIDHYRSADTKYGYNLCPAAGSVKGIKRSKETKRKHSVRSKAMWEDEEYRAKMCEMIKANRNTPEAKEKMENWWESPAGQARRAALTEMNRVGRPHSEETKKILSELNKGKKQSKELVEKRVAPLRGKKQSAELIAKRIEGLRRYHRRKRELANDTDEEL